jgi:hypothetical protein
LLWTKGRKKDCRMSSDYKGLKQYPQEKRKATVHNVEWMRKFLATIETHPELFQEVIGPLWDARLEAQEEIESLREERVATHPDDKELHILHALWMRALHRGNFKRCVKASRTTYPLGGSNPPGFKPGQRRRDAMTQKTTTPGSKTSIWEQLEEFARSTSNASSKPSLKKRSPSY